MGMLKHSIGLKRDKNNDTDIKKELRYLPEVNSLKLADASKGQPVHYPDKMEQRLAVMNVRNSCRYPMANKSTAARLHSYDSGRSAYYIRDSVGNTRGCKIFTCASAVFILVILIISGLIHYYVTFFPQNFYLNHGDIKIIQYSSYFCGSVFTTGTDIPTRLTTLSKVEKSKNRIIYGIFETLQISPGDIWKRSFYLMESSVLVIEVESIDIFDIIFFHGAKNFDIWNSRKEANTYIMRDTCCGNKRTAKKSYTLEAQKDGHYYVIFYRTSLHASTINIGTTFDFNRTSLDFSSTVSTCISEAQKSCQIDLRFASRDFVAIEIPRKSLPKTIPKAESITWKCNRRIWFFFFAYGLSYLISLLFVVILYICYTKTCFYWCSRKYLCCKSTNDLNDKKITNYNNDAYSICSPSPSVKSLQWNSEYKTQNIKSYKEDLSANTPQKEGSFESSSRSRCSKQLSYRSGKHLTQHDVSGNGVATIYSEEECFAQSLQADKPSKVQETPKLRESSDIHVELSADNFTTADTLPYRTRAKSLPLHENTKSSNMQSKRAQIETPFFVNEEVCRSKTYLYLPTMQSLPRDGYSRQAQLGARIMSSDEITI